ncbi:histidine kinase [Salinicoccus halitifaciens]|uniref:histidine kinase n=1 Tax=Salinicoccus halitifaciens TaxID=1073415 RepID=A0ABV2EC73_9STAP
MSIKNRLLISNIGMILIPVAGFFLIEIVLGYTLFVIFEGNPEGTDMRTFLALRLSAMVLILVFTNGLLSWYVSRSIIKPIEELSLAAKKISEGDLNHSVETDRRDELGELGNTFDDMRRKLSEARERQKQYEANRQELLAGITHDLKTPLTSIKGYVHGIQDGVANTPEKLERYAGIISKTADNMDMLLDELLLYTKIDSDQLPYHFESIDLQAFLSDMVEDLSFDMEGENGKVRLHADGEETFIVKADRDKLKRAISNVVQNSLKYMDKDKKMIEVNLMEDGKDVIIEVRDNGSGISEKDLPFIFESFYRADASRNSETGGSGLGLSIVKKIIEAHGGIVLAESAPGEGTSIYFRMERVE